MLAQTKNAYVDALVAHCIEQRRLNVKYIQLEVARRTKVILGLCQERER